MELVEGEDLAQRIARGAIPLGEALPIAKQITAALAAAHDTGIVHRDLKLRISSTNRRRDHARVEADDGDYHRRSLPPGRV